MNHLATPRIVVAILLMAVVVFSFQPIDARDLDPEAAAQARSSGPARRSLIVEGEYDAVRVPHHADLNPRSALTIELWLKRVSSAGCSTLVGKDRSAGYWFAVCDGRLRFAPRGTTSAADGSAVLAEGRWVHVAVTYDGSERRFYVDGVLDRSTSESPFPLGASASELAIGADALLGAPFAGRLDLVRLWHVVRTEAEIRDHRTEVLPRQPGLVAQWVFDGHADDYIGGHDGRATSGASYSFDGAQPRDITVPLTLTPVTVDGRCDASEYGGAERVAIDSADATRVLVQADASNVYVCVAGMPRPNVQNGFAAVLLDRNASRDALAGTGDYRLSVTLRGTAESEEGDGRGGWRDVDLTDDAWDAVRYNEQHGTSGDRWSAEFRVRRSLIDRPTDPDSPIVFGLGVTHSATSSTAGDLFWPAGTTENAPASWSVADLAEGAGVPPRSTFSGTVHQARADGDMVGLPGALLQLLAVDEDDVFLVAEDVSDGGGQYTLEYRGHPPDTFLVREIDPRGVTSVTADPGADGEAIAPNLLSYEVDAARAGEDTAYSAARFTDVAGEPAPQALAQHYLIVYAAPVEEADLERLIRAKRRQGFRVTTIGTADLERTGVGRDLAEKIHHWLGDYWEAVDPEPVYALLVGRGDKIPVRDIGWFDNDHRSPARPDYYPAWPTEWYYADLDSEWDANGNGYHGEFLRCPPGETYRDPEADKGERDCPEDGSLRREGPFGALRGTEDDFQPEIAVGRLALNQPSEVRRAIDASLLFEASGGEDKRRALLAGAFWSFEGTSYVDAESFAVHGGSPLSDPWLSRPWDGAKPYGHDAAEAMDDGLRALLTVPMDEVFRLYQSTGPGGDASLGPTRRTPDAPLLGARLAMEWQDGHHGLVHVAGNGTPDGVIAAQWLYDWSANREIDQPSRALECSGLPVPPLEQLGPPCNDLIPERVLDASLPAPSGVPPVVVAQAGATGAIAWALEGLDAAGNVSGLRYGPPAIAGALPSRGGAAAWVGALGEIEPGALDTLQTTFSARLLTTPQRLGDAFWHAAAAHAAAAPYEMRSYGLQLFGDPALSYWGSPADSAAAWAQDGGDWRGTGASPYSGPTITATAWETRTELPGSPPVVGRDGELVVLGSTSVVRYAPSGAMVGRATVAGAPPGTTRLTPALAEDAVYAAVDDRLYAFDRALGGRGTVTLPAAATGAPRIGPDGVVWVPTRAGMTRVTGDRVATVVHPVQATGAASFLPTGEAVWPTGNGAVVWWHITPSGEQTSGQIGGPGLGALTDVAVSSEGTVYVGSDDGRLWAFPREAAAWNVGTGGAIRARPTLGHGGAVYVVNARGTVLAFEPESRRERWRTELGAVASAPPAVDGSRLYVVAADRLVALDLATGSLVGQTTVGDTDSRSTPVIGPDRTIYLVRADQTLVAVREYGWLAGPTDVTLTGGGGGTTVRWRDNSDAEIGFRVELCDLNDECDLAGTTGPNVESMLVPQLPVDPGNPFYARVITVGRAGLTTGDSGAVPASVAQSDEVNQSSDYALSAIAHAPSEAPSVPSDLRAEATGTEAIALTWRYDGDRGALVGFTISRRRDGQSSYQTVTRVGADATRYVDLGLRPDTTYRYRLLAETERGVSQLTEAEATSWAVSSQGPTELRAVADRDRVSLSWLDMARDESGTIVERRGPGRADYQVVGRLGAGATGFVDTLHLEEGQYHYRVTTQWEHEAKASRPATIGAFVTRVELFHIALPFALSPRQR